MAQVRRLVELGRAARASSSVRTRQPLARALVGAPGFSTLPAALRAQVAEELNLHSVDPLGGPGEDAGQASVAGLMNRTVKPNFRALGKRFGSRTKAVAAAIGAADPDSLVESLRSSGSVQVEVDGAPVPLASDEVIVTETPRSGWAVATEGGETVALDLAITPELRREGLAREVIRLIQDARKNAGLDVSDRIELWWASDDDDVSATFAEHGDAIGGEVLAVSRTAGVPGEAARGGGLHEYQDPDLGLRFWLRRA
jgi:isoleucyl-tRNA synthetase